MIPSRFSIICLITCPTKGPANRENIIKFLSTTENVHTKSNNIIIKKIYSGLPFKKCPNIQKESSFLKGYISLANLLREAIFKKKEFKNMYTSFFLILL
jgi:hypothetical protein